MEIKYLLIDNKLYSYTFIFLNPSEISISLYEGDQKVKTITAKILAYDANTGFLAFDVGGHVSSMVVQADQQTIQVLLCTDHQVVECKKIHVPPQGGQTSFRPESNFEGAMQDLVSPLSGRIVQIFVKNGDSAKAASPLVVIESMKMENVLYASRDAVIKTVFISVGDLVKQNQRLISFKRAGEVYGACQTTGEF